MAYKSTRKQPGESVFLGMEEHWVETKKGTKFVTGMHFRDAAYPIKIRRYPADGTMVTDSQRLGVSTGQFIRAQRLCSTMETFKTAVKGICMAAMRRGYKRKELDRMWGKFLIAWWKAEEVRRGELRSWFRKMTSVVTKAILKENKGLLGEGDQAGSKPQCRHGGRCWYKNFACPFAHPGPARTASKSHRQPHQGEETQGTPAAQDDPMEVGEGQMETPEEPRPGTLEEKESIPKTQASVWKATGDGTCLFYSVLKSNDIEAGRKLRRAVAEVAERNWNMEIEGLGVTVEQLVTQRPGGQTKQQYLSSITSDSHYGGEIELVLLARMLDTRLRIFRDNEESWTEYAEYGTGEKLSRLLYRPRTPLLGPHYDVLVPKEAWDRERQMVESEKAARKEREEARVPVNNLDLGNAKTKAREETGRRQQQMRQQRLEATRSQPVLDLDCSAIVDLLDMMEEGHAPEPDHSSQNAGPHRPTRVRTQPKLYQSEEVEAMERERRRGADPGGAAGSQQDTGVERDGLVGVATAEAESHDWKEGERLGEAQNPGPPTHRHSMLHRNQPSWNHAPGQSNTLEQVPAGWRDTWAVPQAPAGEFAKGNNPGPKTSSAGVGPDPRRNAGWTKTYTAMNRNMSRAGTAQHTTVSGRGVCWYGSQCW